jgi:hypothetical protein
MTADKTPNALFNWIYEVCSLYVNPFVYEYVVNVQHRGKGAADRTTAHIVREFMNKLLNDPNLKYILDTIRNEKNLIQQRHNWRIRYTIKNLFCVIDN